MAEGRYLTQQVLPCTLKDRLYSDNTPPYTCQSSAAGDIRTSGEMDFEIIKNTSNGSLPITSHEVLAKEALVNVKDINLTVRLNTASTTYAVITLYLSDSTATVGTNTILYRTTTYIGETSFHDIIIPDFENIPVDLNKNIYLKIKHDPLVGAAAANLQFNFNCRCVIQD